MLVSRTGNRRHFCRKTFFCGLTTTPWTLPLNRAVALNPAQRYEIYEFQGNYYVINAESVAVCIVISSEYRLIKK